MLTVVRCPNCGNAWDADERPEACEVCQSATQGPDGPQRVTQAQDEAFWEPLRALMDEFRM